jgi:hypothetical protein
MPLIVGHDKDEKEFYIKMTEGIVLLIMFD